MATCSWSCGLITTRSCYSLPFTTALPLPTQHRRCLRCRAAQTTETRIKWRREMSQPRTKNSARVTIEISIDRYPRPWMGMRKLEVWSRGDPKKKGARKFVLGAESRRSTPCEATDKCMWSPPSLLSPTFEDACDRSHGKGVVSFQISPCP